MSLKLKLRGVRRDPITSYSRRLTKGQGQGLELCPRVNHFYTKLASTPLHLHLLQRRNNPWGPNSFGKPTVCDVHPLGVWASLYSNEMRLGVKKRCVAGRPRPARRDGAALRPPAAPCEANPSGIELPIISGGFSPLLREEHTSAKAVVILGAGHFRMCTLKESLETMYKGLQYYYSKMV